MHHKTIRQINQEIIKLCTDLKTTRMSGQYLVLLYELLHEIDNHGFDENKMYEVHIKNNQYVMINEIYNVPARKKK